MGPLYIGIDKHNPSWKGGLIRREIFWNMMDLLVGNLYPPTASTLSGILTALIKNCWVACIRGGGDLLLFLSILYAYGTSRDGILYLISRWHLFSSSIGCKLPTLICVIHRQSVPSNTVCSNYLPFDCCNLNLDFISLRGFLLSGCLYILNHVWIMCWGSGPLLFDFHI